MSDDLPDDPREKLLPSSLKASLLRDLSPTSNERVRVQAGIAAAVSGAQSSPIIERADAQMAARAAELEAGSVVAGTSIATKVVVSSLLLASVASLAIFGLRRGEDPRVMRPPSVAPREEPAPAARPAPPSAAPVMAQPSAAPPATKLEAQVERPTPPSPVRTRRARIMPAPAEAAPPTIAPSPPERSAPAAVSGEPKPAPSLAAELALVRSASAALDRKDAKAALALLARYPQAYPAGSLAIEVQALRAMALCLDEHSDAARARDAFLREYPSSALAERVRSSCR